MKKQRNNVGLIKIQKFTIDNYQFRMTFFSDNLQFRNSSDNKK